MARVINTAVYPDDDIHAALEINMVKNGLRPVHPGEILREEYIVPMGMSVHALSQALRVPATRLHEIVKERRSITLSTYRSP